tara:strand:- start:265 stop:1020 length:756 start_codon:yes stop_codon:yes gene_type:complete
MKLGRLIIPTIIATAIAIIAWGFFGGNNSPEVISSSLESSSKEKANTSNQPIAKIIKDKKTKKLNNKAAPASPTQSAQSSPTEKANKPLTREQLNARAITVEKVANKRLDDLTLLLDLSEEQKDFIFPILAKSAADFHPSLIAQGNELIKGIETAVQPGAPVDVVESEIYDILDEEQKLILEEEAVDREAWWDDIVALLDNESKQSVNSNTDNPVEESSSKSTQQTYNQEDREKNAAKSKIDDFSSLLKQN